MTTKHTPGPWIIEGEAVYADRDARSRHRNGRACVASVCTGEYDELDAEGHANARLIAAAPDLLKSLRDMRAIVHDYLTHADQALNAEAIERADAILARAESH